MAEQSALEPKRDAITSGIAEGHGAEQAAADRSVFERAQERAYYLWEQVGQSVGDMLREQFWFDVERIANKWRPEPSKTDPVFRFMMQIVMT